MVTGEQQSASPGGPGETTAVHEDQRSHQEVGPGNVLLILIYGLLYSMRDVMDLM